MVHTNARADESRWSKAMGDIPGLEFVRVVPPLQTLGSQNIIHLAHQSDFVRLEVLITHGGVYLDFDAFPIRDISPLRHLLFGVVLGQVDGFIGNGVILAESNSPVLKSFLQAMHDQFNNSKWETDVLLLAEVVKEHNNEVIVLPHHALLPFDWTEAGHHELYITSKPWDWRNTYMIHGYFSQLSVYEHTGAGRYIKEYLQDPWAVYKGRCRFSQAVHGAIQAALEAGHLHDLKSEI
eukprot:gene22807-29972_t